MNQLIITIDIIPGGQLFYGCIYLLSNEVMEALKVYIK